MREKLARIPKGVLIWLALAAMAAGAFYYYSVAKPKDYAFYDIFPLDEEKVVRIDVEPLEDGEEHRSLGEEESRKLLELLNEGTFRKADSIDSLHDTDYYMMFVYANDGPHWDLEVQLSAEELLFRPKVGGSRHYIYDNGGETVFPYLQGLLDG